MCDGTVLRFPGEGNHPAYSKQGDLVITLNMERSVDERIIREGNNLIYRHQISLADALNSAPFEFKTLDNETLKFTCDELISP